MPHELPSARGLKFRLSVRGRVRSKRCSAKINDSSREFAHSKSLAIASRSSASSDDRDPFRPRPRFTLPGAHAAAPPPSVLLALSRSPPPRATPCALHRARRGSAQVKAACGDRSGTRPHVANRFLRRARTSTRPYVPTGTHNRQPLNYAVVQSSGMCKRFVSLSQLRFAKSSGWSKKVCASSSNSSSSKPSISSPSSTSSSSSS